MKVETLSQIAAPKDGEVSSDLPKDVTALDPPGAHESSDGFADRSPPGMAKSNLSLRSASFR